MEPITPRTTHLPLPANSAVDPAGFGDAMATAAERSNLAETAEQLEALLVERMLQSMRRSAQVPGQEKSHGNVEFFQQMADQELARHIVSSQRSGLAHAIERQLSPGTETQPDEELTSTVNRSIDMTRTSK